MDADLNANAALVDALSRTVENPVDVALEVGASAAQLGYPLDEVFTSLEAAYASTRGGLPDYEVIKAAATAWGERNAIFACEVSCEDPLTTLATVAHLRSRLEDAYRVAASRSTAPEAEYALVVIQRGERDHQTLESSLENLLLAQILRRVFDADETFAQVAPHRVAVLVHQTRAERIAILRNELDRHGLTSCSVRLWVECLPPTLDDVGWMLNELGR